MEYQTQIKSFGNIFSRLKYIHLVYRYNQHLYFNGRKIINNNNNLQNNKSDARRLSRY